jgi:uncharacterized lipoprotein YddW (UPF0748 family)
MLAVPGQSQSRQLNDLASLPPPAPPSAAMGEFVSNLSNTEFVKAIWVDGLGPALKSAENIRKLVADCREMGINTIYAQMRIHGDAFYRTTVVPRSRLAPPDLDCLDVLLREARSGGKRIRVYAMFVTHRVWSGDRRNMPENHVAARHPDWLTRSEDGGTSVGDTKDELWLDPGLVEVQDHLALVAADLVRNYDVDGLLLDRMRYPDITLRSGYNPKAVERYNRSLGRTGTPLPTDSDWITWRRSQITQTVRKMREAVRASRPSVRFAVASITYGPGPTTLDAYRSSSVPYAAALQDWVGWCDEGIIDENVLMNFRDATTDAADFDRWTVFALENKGKAKVTIGVAGFLNHPKYTLAMMLDPIFNARADGVALYSYHEPALKSAQVKGAFGVLRQGLDPDAVSAKAREIARLSGSSGESEMFDTPADREAAMRALQMAQVPSPTPASSQSMPIELPTLPSLTGAPAMSSPAPGSPAVLPGVSSPSQTPAIPLPSLGAATAKPPASATPPALPGGPATPGLSLPSLGQVGGQTPKSEEISLPPLPGIAPRAPAASATPATQPSLPALGSLSTPALPSLQPLAPAAPPAMSQPPVATSLTPAPSLGISPPSSDVVSPPSFTGSPFDASASRQAATLGAPTLSGGRRTLNIPDYGPSTNYTGEPIAGPQPVSPLITPPSLGTDGAASPGMRVGGPYALQPTAPPPPPVSQEDSVYTGKAASSGFHYYAPQRSRPPLNPATAVATPESLEVISLKNGKRFSGKVLEEGARWKIQLPNGSIITLPGSKVLGRQQSQPGMPPLR